jgi:hypothetical protein
MWTVSQCSPEVVGQMDPLGLDLDRDAVPRELGARLKPAVALPCLNVKRLVLLDGVHAVPPIPPPRAWPAHVVPPNFLPKSSAKFHSFRPGNDLLCLGPQGVPQLRMNTAKPAYFAFVNGHG